MSSCESIIRVENLETGYGELILQKDLSFQIKSGEIFIIMGGSGCGKSTLLRYLIGLQAPQKGHIFLRNKDFWMLSSRERKRMMRQMGVLYQSGALWSDMTLRENVSLPMQNFTTLSKAEIKETALHKLALVDLADFSEYYPAEISGGMKKRAGLARALSLDPDIVFFDEPSAGLDPISSKHLDELILKVRDDLGTTVIVVTHELPSIFAIGDNAIYLDAQSKTTLAQGKPTYLRDHTDNPTVYEFLHRGEVMQ